jgi:hypothetical protein
MLKCTIGVWVVWFGRGNGRVLYALQCSLILYKIWKLMYDGIVLIKPTPQKCVCSKITENELIGAKLVA